LACIVSIPLAVYAQNSTGNSASKWDIFAGYSYLAPYATVQVPQPNGTNVTAAYDAVNVGGLFSGAYFFNRYLGVQGEFGLHEWGTARSGSTMMLNGETFVLSPNIGTHRNDDGFTTVAGGVILRDPTGDLEPFAHVLVGGALVGGPYFNPNTWGPSLTVGGGMDFETPWLNHRLAVRILQADYEFMHVNFGTGVEGVVGGTVGINAVRLSTGIVLHSPLAAPVPVTLSCSASPDSVYPGDPVTVTATAGNVSPKLHVVYNWEGEGVTGNGSAATVATASLAPGVHTVNCGVKEGKPGKEGLKPWESAEATASFTVKAFEPPTVSCSASPSTIKPGETSTVTAIGVSPQNRPLTYSYSAAAGTINGSGATAEFNSAGAPTGEVAITCNATDDKGQAATSQTSVTITAPYVAPAPHTEALCSLSFSTDKTRPTRVNNEAKACLDEVALDLEKQSDAKAVIVGNADAQEKARMEREEAAAKRHHHLQVQDVAAERAVNAKAYLVTEKGIDASRVSVVTGTEDGQTAQNYLVPAGADFTADVAGTTAVDESSVKPQTRKPLGVRKHHHRKAAAK
jgi:outer membrane protein OmpA-like peptidoglycan-associated protein